MILFQSQKRFLGLDFKTNKKDGYLHIADQFNGDTSVGPGVSYSHQGNFTYAHSLTQHIPYLFLQNSGCLSTNQSAIREAVMVLFRLPTASHASITNFHRSRGLPCTFLGIIDGRSIMVNIVL